MKASDGMLYGMTTVGGTNSLGVIFKYDPNTNTYTKRVDLSGVVTGSVPKDSLIQVTNGTLYGMTSQGGINGFGVIFQYDDVNDVPVVGTPTVTSIATTTATLGASVTSSGFPATISSRGVCWGTTPAPTTNCSAEGGTTTGVFAYSRTGLPAGTLVYYRGYATNTTGTGYSPDGTFTTNASQLSVSLSYSSSFAKVGVNTITATYKNSVLSTPTISINQPGTIDITNATMSGSGAVYTYNYTVNQSNGTTYVDGLAVVSLSTVSDATGDPSLSPSNNTFTIDTVAPTAALSYSSTPARQGTEVITATFSEPLSGAPNISVNQPGTADIINAPMTNAGASNWTTGTIGYALDDITYGKGLFMGINRGGNIYSSSDGINWTAPTQSVMYPYSIAYGNGMFVALPAPSYGVSGSFGSSADGVTWTRGSSQPESNIWRSVTYGNGIFVGVSDTGTNRVITSTDGINWTARTAIEADPWMSITYGNNLFVAVAGSGTNIVMTSPDGITWTKRTVAAATALKSVTYGNGLFVAVVSNVTDKVITSSDGINWTAANISGLGLTSITYGSGIFAAIGIYGVATSLDGITWANKVTYDSAIYPYTNIFYANNLFLTFRYGLATREMTAPATQYSYNYTVNGVNGTTYMDGSTSVSLSGATDLAGNVSSAPTNATFVIDSVQQTVILTSSTPDPATGAIAVTATFNEPTSNFILSDITVTNGTAGSFSGSGTVYNFVVTPTSNGLITVNIASGVATDAAGNLCTGTITAPVVGDIYGGGVVAYILQSGDPGYANDGITRGIIVSTDNQSLSSTWDATGAGPDVSGAMGTAIGTGLANTNAIISVFGHNFAAYAARSYTGGGYTDWYLPSTDELNKLYLSKAYTGNFQGVNYWSSTEFNLGWAYRQDFNTGTIYSYGGKNTGYAVRAIRSLSVPTSLTRTFSGVVITSPTATSITKTTATLGANIASLGSLTISSRGTCWGTTPAPTTNCLAEGGTTAGVYTQNRTGFTQNTTYYYRGYAISSAGTSYTPDGTFLTLGAPTVTTPTVSTINLTTATLGANVTSLGLPAAISARGICWGTTPTPTTNCITASGTAIGVFTQAVTGLTAGTLYYYRGYAINASGTGYSPDGTFTTEVIPSVALSYSSSIMGTGSGVITATYSKPITTIPAISIAQQGTATISSAAMTNNTWTIRTPASSNYWQAITFGNGIFVAVSWDGAVMRSTNGINWTSSTPSVSGIMWNSVTYGNSLFIATGGSSAIMSSPDGITWTTRTNPSSYSGQSTAYGNGMFVSISYNSNSISTSPDGITWTERTGTDSNAWRSITYGNGLFVAVSQNGTNRVMTSPDGITWTARTAASANSWWSVTYGNGLFVAISNDGTNQVMTSPDGITWTARTAASASNWVSVTYGNGIFIAIANNSNAIMISPNGINWTVRTAPVSAYWTSVVYGNGLFVAVADVTSGVKVMTSPRDIATVFNYTYVVNKANGTTYKDGTATVSLSSSVDSLGNTTSAPTNNTFTINTTGPDVALSYSSNPVGTGPVTITATYSGQVVGSPKISIDQPGTTDVTNVAMNGNGLVRTYSYMVNKANGGAYVDGVVAVTLTPAFDSLGNPSNAPTNATFTINTSSSLNVALTYSATPAVIGTETITATYLGSTMGTPKISIDQPGSADIVNATMTPGSASSWISRSSPISPSQVTFGNGIFVSVTPGVSTNSIMTSPDGINWTLRTNPNCDWRSIAFGNGIFVVTGLNGTQAIMTSTDGINWTYRNAVVSALMSVTYGNGLFVAVSPWSSAIVTSPDGITWTLRTVAVPHQWYSVAYGNGMFVTIANGYNLDNMVAYSSNGIDWFNSTAVINNMYSIAYGNGIFVAVGGNNPHLMSSSDGINWVVRIRNNINFSSISYGKGLFVASDGNSLVDTSTDGINWTMCTPNTAWTMCAPGSGSFWQSITAGKGLYVAVSIGGNIMTYLDSSIFTYDYTVHPTDGSNYINGTATVNLSNVTDASGNPANTPTNNTFVINTPGPSVALTYTSNPAGAGVNTITATYSKAIVGTPNISIDQPGSTDITNVAMSGSGLVRTYSYTVNQKNGTTYKDGLATVSLSSVTDTDGNISSPPTNNTFTINTDTVSGLNVGLSYSVNPAPVGINRISATYSKAITSVPTISIDQPGATDISNVLMNAPASNWVPRLAIETNAWTDITYGNNLFVAVSVEGKIMTSADGVAWTQGTTTGSTWVSVAYGNGTFVAVAQNGGVMTSSNGMTWTTRTPINYFQWNSITYGNGLFVAVSSNGTNRVMTSPDGINWTARTTPEANTWTSITYGQGIFVAVSYDGASQVMTSPDGIIWTAQTAQSSNWTSITYGQGIFVAVSWNGTVMTSSDGITWTLRTAAQSNPWQSVAYGNGIFVAVSSTGVNRVMTSPDGNTWTIQTAANQNSWQSVAYGNGTFVAVSSNGTNQVMTSPDTYYYDYTVNKKDGINYIDGITTVSLSSVLDALGETSNAPTNNTFTIKTDASTIGILTSSVFDTTADSSNIKYNSIMWKGTLGGVAVPPNEGKVRFQLATSSDPAGPWNYYGGDTCGAQDWYDPQGPDSPIELKGTACIPPFGGNRYFKYKVEVCSNDCVSSGPNTPTVNNVIVNWSP